MQSVDLLGRSLRLNGAMFYNDYEDIQMLITRAGSVTVENASKASIEGVKSTAPSHCLRQITHQSELGFIL